MFTYYWRHCEAFEILVPFSSVQFSHSVTSNSLQLHEMQHARLPCPSPTPGACSNSCTSSQWCHPTISSSVIPFASCLQSFPASGSFPMSQFFASGGQSIGVPASASVFPMIKPMPPALEGRVLTAGPPGKSQGVVLRLQACGHLWQWPQESNIPSWPISSLALFCPLTPHSLISWGGGFHQWVSYTQCLSYRESDLRLGDCQLGRHQFGFPRADLAPDHFLGVCSGQTSWTVFSQELMGQNWSFYLDIHLSLHLHGHWILALIPPPRGAEPEK